MSVQDSSEQRKADAAQPLSASAPKVGGQPYRGERLGRTVRYPVDWQEHLKRSATAAGLGDDLGAYITLVLAEHEHFPVPEYIHKKIDATRRKQEAERRRRSAEELDLPKSA